MKMESCQSKFLLTFSSFVGTVLAALFTRCWWAAVGAPAAVLVGNENGDFSAQHFVRKVEDG
ncbi:MAG: hypothetical protein DWI57_03170 [Chloroflexi bacterium]|nr:MAG: hypothetical protein DWI57_03170 [Chloroflexota bacterium]